MHTTNASGFSSDHFFETKTNKTPNKMCFIKSEVYTHIEILIVMKVVQTPHLAYKKKKKKSQSNSAHNFCFKFSAKCFSYGLICIHLLLTSTHMCNSPILTVTHKLWTVNEFCQTFFVQFLKENKMHSEHNQPLFSCDHFNTFQFRNILVRLHLKHQCEHTCVRVYAKWL